jgi:chemotaxis protein MotA
LKGLNSKKYVHISRKRFDPFALIASFAGLGAVLYVVQGVHELDQMFDLNSLLIVGVGTVSSLLFQFDFGSFLSAIVVILKSFLGSPEKRLLTTLKDLDRAILEGTNLQELREGHEITGEILGDIVCMYRQGLLYDEIDEFVTSKVADDYLLRKTTVSLLNKAAIIAPSLGLFGTVMGLIGVLKSLNNPAQIGPAMSLALMTTAYGAGLGSLVFTPLAGRIEHQNTIYIENHRQLLSKIAILLKREDRRLDRGRELILDVA